MSFLANIPSPVGVLNSIQKGRNLLDSVVNKFVLRPGSGGGISGEGVSFVFDYEGDTIVTVSSEITDHYTEQNSAIQDHIGIRPERLVLRGFVGELVQQAPQGVTGLLATVKNKLSTVPAYLGKWTPGAIDTIQNGITKVNDAVNTFDEALARGKNVLDGFNQAKDLFSGKGPTDKKTKQADAYYRLKSLCINKVSCTVQTPYNLYQNMFIESVVFVQDEETKFRSEITVVLKELRFADSVDQPDISLTTVPKANAQRKAPVNLKRTNGSKNSLPSKFGSYTRG